MKRIKYVLATLVAVVATAIPVFWTNAAATNLITNPSVESGSGTAPTDWTSNKWGTNTAVFSRPTDAKDGSKSVKAELTAWTNGDAKWMHKAAAVTAGKTYVYKSSYKSNVSTSLILGYTTASNVATYVTVKSIPAASAWTDVTAEFTVPANQTKVQVLHVLAAKGWVQNDAFSLYDKAETTNPTDPGTPTNPGTPATNLIVNPSFETASSGTPANWTSNKWGTNTSSFSYATTGRTGSRSVVVNTTTWTNGDAKWMANPVNVTAGKTYTYSDYYKAGKVTKVIAAYQNASGAVTYVSLANAPIATNWTPYTATLTVPTGMTKVTVYHLVDSVTTLSLDDVSLSENGGTTPTDPTDPGTPSTGNMIANPSMETANGTIPASWSSNSWGTNAGALTYDTTGRTGKSVTAALTAYTDGDAKWYFDAVNVTAGKTYTYKEYYKSTTPTYVLAAFQNSAGTYSYVELGTVAASASWTEFTANIPVPAGMTKLSVYHVIADVGSLSIDDTDLRESTTTTPPASSIIPNSSVETGTTAPTGWTNNAWGTNTPTFEYITNEGRTGTKSLKLTMANRTDGDAKWYFNPITTLQSGKQYRFTAWYKTNTLPETVAMFTMADGSTKFFGMPDAQPATNAATVWQKYTDTFSVPTGATGVSVFMFLDKNGWLQTDDYSIENYTPTGFNRGLVTLTFDDGHEENAANALPILQQFGFKSTQCFATSFIEGQPQATIDKVLAFKNAGHEICSHSVTHPQMTTLTDTVLDYEAKHSQEYLQSLIGGTVPNFATPYGDYNQRVVTTLKKYYNSHRSVDEGYNSKDNYDKYRLRVQNILDTTTAAQVQQWVQQAQADKTWLILVYHRVANNPGPFDSYINDFTAQMQAIKNTGVTVKTYQEALTETQSQL